MGRLGKFVFSFVLFIIVCYGGLVWFANHEVEKGFNAAVDSTEGLDVTYADLWFDLFDRTVTLTDVKATLASGKQYTADEVIVYAFDERHSIPHFIRAQANGLTVTPPVLGLPVTPEMKELTGDLTLDYRYDSATKSLNLATLAFDEARLGKVEVSGTMTQLDLDQFRVENLVGLRIKDAEFRLRNRQLMDTLFENGAAALGATPEVAQQQLIAELDMLAEQAGKANKPIPEKAFLELKRFVEQPEMLIVRAAPQEPVPYLYFFMGRDLYENLHLLNLSVESRIVEKNQ